MTRLLISFAAAAFTLSLAPAARAYGTEPVMTVRGATETVIPAELVCRPAIGPVLALAIGLPAAPPAAC